MKIIETTGDDRYSIIGLVDEIPTSLNANLLGILHEGWKHHAYFLPDGRKVTLSAASGHEIKNRPLSVLLANTVYNPRREVTVEHVETGSYEIDDLKSSIMKWLGQDDDILTQFLNANGIEKLLAPVQTFDDLVLAVRAINGEFETDKTLEQHLVSLGIPGFTDEEEGQQ
jgi:hypothetical protein